jgi:predicted naringenin-chalcone synthase
MTLALAGFGTAVPEHVLTQQEAVELHTTFCGIDDTRARTLRALYRRSGVARRHSVILSASEGPLPHRQAFYPPARCAQDPGPATATRMERYEAHAPPLAADACRRALRCAGVRPSEVSHLVTVSCTGFFAPGLDAAVIDALELSRDAQRTHVGFMGCHGALNGLRLADSFVHSDPGSVVLVCSVELCSLHFAYGWDPEMLVANALFADGAAAVVGRAHDPSDADAWCLRAMGTHLMPDSEEDMSWRIGDHGFRMTLSARVPDLIQEHVGTWLRAWLCAYGLGIEDIASWAVHPGGPRILGAVERTVGASRAISEVPREVLAEFGNMSSATILFILQRLRERDAPRPCLALAFGPGLVVEAALIV